MKHPATLALIGLLALVHALGVPQHPLGLAHLALWPPGSGGVFHPVQLVTYSLLHGSLLHLGFNVFALWMFGRALEARWGAPRFLATWLLSVIVAAMTQFVVNGYLMPATGPVIGASGGVFGLLAAYALYFPNRALTLVFLPVVRIPARVFVAGYALVELALGVTQTAAGIAHFAHLGGLFGGWLAVQYFRGRGVLGGRR